jgi:hypothetical protein
MRPYDRSDSPDARLNLARARVCLARINVHASTAAQVKRVPSASQFGVTCGTDGLSEAVRYKNDAKAQRYSASKKQRFECFP